MAGAGVRYFARAPRARRLKRVTKKFKLLSSAGLTRDGGVALHARELPRCEEADQTNRGWGSTVVFLQNPFPPRVIPAAFANRNPGVRVRIFNCDVNVNDVDRRSLSLLLPESRSPRCVRKRGCPPIDGTARLFTVVFGGPLASAVS